MEENKTIDRQTMVSIGLIITGVAIVGSTVWMFATLTANVNSNTVRIDRMEVMLERVATKDDVNKLEENIRTYILKD